MKFESYSNREGEGKRSLIRPRSKLSFSLDHSWCTSGRRYYDCTKDYGKRDRLTGWLAYRFLMGERVLSMFSKLNGGLTVIHGHAYPSGYFAPFTDVNNRSFFNWSYSHFLLYAIPEFIFLKCLFWFRTQPYNRNWIDWPEPYFCFTARVILKLPLSAFLELLTNTFFSLNLWATDLAASPPLRLSISFLKLSSWRERLRDSSSSH